MSLGFVGLGVMGAPMCMNLAAKSGQPVLAVDVRETAIPGAKGASLGDLRQCDVVFLSLPGAAEVQAVAKELSPRRGACVVDLSTTTVSLARSLHEHFGKQGVAFADAPVARTREAAQKGTLSVMVGASAGTFDRIRPLLACMASDITHCGGPGAGQAMKLANNMMLFQNVVAVAEGLALARHAGVDPALALEVLSKGSADSFALRNHGMKAILPGVYPERAFSTEYALKDLRYALELAREAGLDLTGARNARKLLEKSRDAGFGAEYFPALAKVVS
ncbi:MAG TPA: NAD(P)-dependent oxidoreductase [Burkholderiales bacterium]|nr:NAD(P)-dependent oxidoreductase [Burkholderiales bacterium]